MPPTILLVFTASPSITFTPDEPGDSTSRAPASSFENRNLQPMSATITQDQVAYKKKIGRLGGSPVYEVGLIGGLHLVMKAGEKAPLGAGPHRAVARHIAKKKNPELEFTELSKGDWMEPYLYEALVPKYEHLTDELARLARE